MQVTTERLEALPTELPKFRRLSDVRTYVADSVAIGDTPALLPPDSPVTRRKRQAEL